MFCMTVGANGSQGKSEMKVQEGTECVSPDFTHVLLYVDWLWLLYMPMHTVFLFGFSNLQPIHLPLLCVEMTAGIRLFAKGPLKKHAGASVLGYIKVISCQASQKYPLSSASKAAD